MTFPGKIAAGVLLGISIATVAAVAQPSGPETRNRVESLKKTVAGLNQKAKAAGGGHDQLRKDLGDLRTRVEGIAPPKALPPPSKDGEKSAEGPLDVPAPMQKEMTADKKSDEKEFRLPLSRKSDKEPNVAIVCEGKKISLLDIQSLDSALIAEKNRNGKAFQSGGIVKVAGGDFDVELSAPITMDLGNVRITTRDVNAVRKKDREGETLEQIQQPGSALQKRLALLKPEKNIIQFCVYPDSYDEFQGARKLVFDKKFEVGWVPMPVGEVISLGGGKATAQ